MELSQTELKALQITAGGEANTGQIAARLGISLKQAYRVCKGLEQKGLLERKRKAVMLSKAPISVMLSNLISETPNTIPLLADSGILILISLLTPKSTAEIANETGLKKSIIYRKIKQAVNISAVRKENSKYAINNKVWPKLKEIMYAIKMQEETIDTRVPLGSIIYFKNNKEIIFSNKADIDAPLTAFSRYEEYGIKLLLHTNFYYLPKKKLSLKQIFLHSLYIAEKENYIYYIIYIALLYIQHKQLLSSVRHPIIENINKVLKGQKVEGYPSLAEIKEKAELYDIKV
ncbi:MAG: MarR family transcriptional regulator [Nanoarchaeota archaeon]|nr:MarR family transcriptional regulator [Nanoarchaeota archaeon]